MDNYSPMAAQPVRSVEVLNPPSALMKVPSPFEAGSSESRSGLLEYGRILMRHKKAIVLSGIAGLLLGIAIGLPLRPVYRARTSLEVLNLNEDFMNLKQSDPLRADDSSEVSEEQTQAKLLNSETLLNRVLHRLESNPAAAAEAEPAVLSLWHRWLHTPVLDATAARRNVLLRTAKTMKVAAIPHTRILEITVDSSDPKLAADFANTLIQEFFAQSIESRWATSHETSEWLTKEIEDARAKLQKSEDALQSYARDSGLIITDDRSTLATNKLQQIQQQLSGATADRIGKQSRYELAKSSPAEALPDVLEDQSLRETQAKMNDLNRGLANLTAVFNPGYSRVKRAQAELDALKAAFDAERMSALNRIQTDYLDASRRERLLASAYDQEARAVTGQGEKEIQYNILKREVDSSRQLYDTMLQQMKQSTVASAFRPNNVRIVDHASVPTFPIFPNPPLNAALGLFAGLGLGAVIVLIRFESDHSVRKPGDVRLWTDLSELGTIPRGPAERRKALPAKSQTSIIGGDTNAESLELSIWRQPSLMAEAFRSALLSILYAEESLNPRVLVVTSPNPGDGKTTVVTNLAIAIAELENKVLIIDADMRRPRMHSVFRVSNERGLSHLLSGRVQEGAASVIQKTGVNGVHVLPAGPATHGSAQLLHSPKFASLLNELRNEYKMILIDTPPMLMMPDARLAGRQADAVVLVTRAGQTSRNAVVAATDRFTADRIRVLGAILNDWDPRWSEDLPKGYYSAASKYGYSTTTN